jgi:tRNA G18 (ribose-2'-O)-methylase SpoU
MGSIFAQRLVQATIAETPRPRVALVAHGGEPLQALAGLGAGTICFGAEREGLPIEVADACETTVTIPIRDRGPESLNVAAAAAIALQWISSPASVEVGDG